MEFIKRKTKRIVNYKTSTKRKHNLYLQYFDDIVFFKCE